MPIIKSAKKRARQAERRRKRNFPIRSSMKTHIKKVLLLAKEGKKEEAEKKLSLTYKIIDTAAKKHIIHKNNAARKKSRLAKAVAKASKVSLNEKAKPKADKIGKAAAKAKKEEVKTVEKA